jgi:hypothetical protein
MLRVLLAFPILVLSTGVLAQEHRIFSAPDALEWQQGPPGLPQGAEFVVLSGDPTARSGSFALRARMPAGFKVPPHSHPTDEQVTVLAGGLRYRDWRQAR